MTVLSNIDFAIQASKDLGAELQNFSKANLEKLKSVNIPTRKTESWKYSAKRLKMSEAYPEFASSKPVGEIENSYLVDAHVIVVSNNIVCLNKLGETDLTIKSFSDLNEAQSLQVINGAIAQSSNYEFSVANAAYLQNGLYINVPKNTHVDKPIRLVFQQIEEGVSFPRIFFNVESGASVTIIEEIQIQASDDSLALVNSVCDINIEANAKAQYLRMNLDGGKSKHIGATGINLHRDARFESYHLALGSELARHDLLVKMLGSGAECQLNGVCITQDKQHYANHTVVEHIAPNCTSDETYRCIADNESQIVFNGRIHIHPDAQKTLGSMSNRNLLLSSKAEIDSKPELEIYADDVKCAHGSTIGQLDETELYYLTTRGISHEQAKLMLTLGFVLEVVHATPIEAIAEFWEQRLSELLSFEI